MINETTARVTPVRLPWEFAYIDGEYAGIWSPSGRADGTPDIYCYPDGDPPNEPTAHEQLMVAAVNAFFALNPTDPLAAAQHIEALVKAARLVCNVSIGDEGDAVDRLEEALTRVIGKP